MTFILGLEFTYFNFTKLGRNKCLAKIKEYKQGLQLPLKKAQCNTEITELLLETHITPCLTDSEVNASLLSYTDTIDATDAAIQ